MAPYKKILFDIASYKCYTVGMNNLKQKVAQYNTNMVAEISKDPAVTDYTAMVSPLYIHIRVPLIPIINITSVVLLSIMHK